jgi:nucleotide-binding universal stress UspA family protein
MTATVLLAADPSAAAARAAELLAGYRGKPGALAAVVLNVQSRPVTAWPGAGLDLSVLEAALLEEGGRIAGRACERLRAAGLAAEPVVRLGPPAVAIAEEAQARGAALVMMGTRGHGALRGFAVGSVALRVAHASAVPVCVVHPEAALPRELGRKLRVLLAVDGSAPALRAAEALAAWRGWLGELDVQIVHVQEPLTLAEQILPPHDDLAEQWSTKAGEEASRAARELFDSLKVKNHLHLSAGEPAVELAHLATRLGCDLVALGTRGLGAAHHALVGSVALKVAAASPVPVLLVR